MQKDGKEYGAADTQTRFGEESCEIRMDIAPAYPAEAGLNHYIRHAVLMKGKEIRIRDTFRFTARTTCDTGKTACDTGKTACNMAKTADDAEKAAKVILSLMTYEKVVPARQGQDAEDGALLEIGEKGVMCISGGRVVKTEEIPVIDERLKTAWKHAIYRTLIAVDGTEAEIRIY